ncbi:tRNA wybutosine-synthesizing protein 3 homolog [Pelobates fuscus]|uniref:tRNA wybutosine-synthesizing protein 3 homolog n=1 Tax=Pelobates fuscus TaxID=191477 RepID=UPI002FE4EF23
MDSHTTSAPRGSAPENHSSMETPGAPEDHSPGAPGNSYSMETPGAPDEHSPGAPGYPYSMETPGAPDIPSSMETPGDSGDPFSRWKLLALRKVDVSKKGSVDPDIADTVRFINLRDSYFTTSSCSGRIILLDENPDISTIQKKNCSWLFVTHQLCKTEDVVEGLQKAVGNAVLKFEPFVLHVQCRSLEDAQLLHSVSINSGFRNSGITVGKKGRIIMAVRSTHCLEVPLCFKGKCLVSNEYITHVVQTANQKMEENFRRIARFHSSLVHALQNKENTSNCEMPPASSVYTRRRRRNKAENRKSDCSSNVEEECDDPEELITLYDAC